jgi:Flp pilus assembly protein TadG
MAALKSRLLVAIRDTRGSEIVEMAFVLPMLLFLMGGILDMGFLFNRYETLTNAAREGARMAAIPGAAEGDVKARVNSYLTAAGIDTAAVTTSVTPVVITVGAGTMNGVKVVVSYPYKYMLLGPMAQLVQASTSFDAVTLTASATMRSEIAAGL